MYAATADKPDAMEDMRHVTAKQKNNKGSSWRISGEEEAQVFLYQCPNGININLIFKRR